MRSEAEMKLSPSELSFRVLQADPARVTPPQAARAVERYLERKRSGLAQALRISAGEREVIIRARGEAPQEMLREARDLLAIGREPAPGAELEVDPDEFAIEPTDAFFEEPELERELLRSKVRYFPHPICEWFEISTGDLTLTDQGIVYEPEWTIMREEEAETGSDRHLIGLAEVESASRGDWWDIPCLMLRTARRTYRYGWPAARGELDAIFDVDEWLQQLRSLLAAQQ